MERKLQYTKLNKNALRHLFFVDGRYNTNCYGTSQLGVIVFRTDAIDNCHLLYYSSLKCLRVTCSMIASKPYDCSFGYNCAVILTMLLKQIKMDLPVYISKDCEHISDTITASKWLKELKLVNVIADMQSNYCGSDIKVRCVDTLSTQHGW